MIEIISPDTFTTTLWKNGKGETTELAISPNSTINEFKWRLSIASVSEDGVFSDFSGYCRNLILLTGNGITLSHTNALTKETKTDCLAQVLNFSTFDGGCKTFGVLTDGAITDFNLMHNPNYFTALVKPLSSQQTIDIEPADICFIYPLSKPALVINKNDNQEFILPQGHLIKLISTETFNYSLNGEQLIVIYLNKL
ncbi:HutD family protein [Thalassotalea psychrophila]|uniref:HutD family protein n=1 Tax=Thalassotalea psychrophila TaxID=3065647 RepID=A0ABY9TQP1_9GAMM|nr:HutD family protein [Colwelliaceae bacterium SQ149]